MDDTWERPPSLSETYGSCRSLCRTDECMYLKFRQIEQYTYQTGGDSPDGKLLAVNLALLESVHKFARLRGFHVAGKAVQGQEVQALFLPPGR